MNVTLAENVVLPVDLPPALTFDCFVPGVGLCEATVDVSAEAIAVTDLRWKELGVLHHCTPGSEVDTAVVEQAGDVSAVFEVALPTGKPTPPVPHWERFLVAEDSKTLRAITTLAQCEADAYSAWCALPDAVTDRGGHCAPGDPEDGITPSKWALQSFVDDVLVPRAQKMAQAAAKKRQAEWEHENRQRVVEERAAAFLDVAIHAAKEGER